MKIKDVEALETKLLEAKDENALIAGLKQYICFRLQLPQEVRENDLYRLVMLSARQKFTGMDARQLEERLATSDCHQTSYVVSKKNLLMMEIEKRLTVTLTDGELERINTVGDYGRALWQAKHNLRGDER